MQDNRPAAPGLQDHPGRHRNGRKDQRQKLRMLGNGDATAKEMKRIIREHLILPAGLLLYRRTPFWLVKPGNPIEQAPSCACPICGFPPRCRRLEPYRGRWRNRFMLVVMQSHATEQQVRAVCQRIESLGLKAHPIPGSLRTAVGECMPVSKPYKLVSRDAKEEDTILRIPTPSGDVIVGGRHVALVAGPCAVETEEQCLAIAERVKKSGARLFRGGAYKPRTSPYSFQGLGESGLKILSKVRAKHGFGIVTEAIDNESLELVEEYSEVLQIV